jgi:hypothetical protein
MRETYPDLLEYLQDRLNYKVRRGADSLGFRLYYLDLSDWHLQFSDLTPVLWLPVEMQRGKTPWEVCESVYDVMRERGLRGGKLLVLVEGDGASLRRAFVDPTDDVIIVDQAAQQAIRSAQSPTGELRDIIAEQISLTSLSPYEKSVPVTGSRFFGRDYEIRRILGNLDSNYVILGIRRIGKTSLLRELRRRLLAQPSPSPIVYLDCSDLLTLEEYVEEVVRKLEPKELPRLHMQNYAFYFPHFLERMSQRHHGKIIFFLDEIDNLIQMQEGHWDLFKILRASSNKGACHYIMAGYREAMNTRYMLDSPFHNFAEDVVLGTFKRQEARSLIVAPMRNMRITIHNEQEVVGRILEETSGQPVLIQHYCMLLLRELDRTGSREISPNSLVKIYNDESFANHLLETFMMNTTNAEKALVYSVLLEGSSVYREGFSQSDIDSALKRQGLIYTQREIEQACGNLVLAGTFSRQLGTYFFAAPIFVKTLQMNRSINYLLDKVKEEEGL